MDECSLQRHFEKRIIVLRKNSFVYEIPKDKRQHKHFV